MSCSWIFFSLCPLVLFRISGGDGNGGGGGGNRDGGCDVGVSNVMFFAQVLSVLKYSL